MAMKRGRATEVTAGETGVEKARRERFLTTLPRRVRELYNDRHPRELELMLKDMEPERMVRRTRDRMEEE